MGADIKNVVINVGGMSCGHCVKAVKNAAEALEGVSRAVVDLDAGTAAVEYDADKVTLEEIKAAIIEEGYEAV